MTPRKYAFSSKKVPIFKLALMGLALMELCQVSPAWCMPQSLNNTQGLTQQAIKPNKVSKVLPTQDQTILLINQSTGRALQIKNWSFSQGAPVETGPAHSPEAIQLWKVLPADGGYYIIHNTQTQKDLAPLKEAGKVGQKIRNDEPLHHWTLKQTSKGTFVISHRESGLALTEVEPGQLALSTSTPDSPKQLWKIERLKSSKTLMLSSLTR